MSIRASWPPLLVLWLATALPLTACEGTPRAQPPTADTEARPASPLWQTGPVAALQNAVYDSITTVGELRQHGDHGVGTFAEVNGELVVVDGEFYQADSTGVATLADDAQPVTFAILTRWPGGATHRMEPNLRYCVGCSDPPPDTTFQTATDSILRTMSVTRNGLYALRLQGTFSGVVTRSFVEQTQPYPCWSTVVAHQRTRTYPDPVQGTMVGFIEPGFVGRMSVADYHLHFITDDGTGRHEGGHVLSFTTGTVHLQVAELGSFQIMVPTAPAYMSADLSRCPG